MKAMTSRSWNLALNLLIIWPLAGWLVAEEIGESPGVASEAADESSLEISSESGEEPAAMEPQAEDATALEESSGQEPAVLPTQSEIHADEVSRDEPPAEEMETDDTNTDETDADENADSSPDRVITPVPDEEKEEKPVVTRNRKPMTHLMPAQRKAALEAMAFRAMRPGVSTKEDLIKAWGAPAEVRKAHGVVTYNYRPKNASRMSVTLTDGLITAIVVQIDPPSAPEELAAKLTVDNLSSIQVADEDGQILGEAFPERGLLFGYSPESDPPVVSQIVLEAPEPQPFLLRAEAELDSDYAQCLADANAALELDPQSAPAQAMRARVYRQAGDLTSALKAAEAAVALEPDEAEWHLILAKVLVQLSDFSRAEQQLQEVLGSSSTDVLARAGASLLLGDTFALSSSRGYGEAVKQHQEAIRLAKTLVDDPRARRRRKACELLIDGHLHVAYSIAWGHFQHKSEAVAKWLDGAATLADNLVKQEVLRPEVMLRVNEQSLAALAGLADPPDATKWENAALAQAKALHEQTTDPTRASQIQWQLGLALCDAVQIEQTRRNYDRALDFGKMAYEHLKRADAVGRQLPDHDFLLGQLFYRLGVIHAVGHQNHKEALVWYGRAVKLLEAPVPPSCVTDPGRHGETFVSIAVSYWETGDQEEAMRLTSQGVKLMEQAVEEGLLAKGALAVPYSNLASMYNELGDRQRATEYAKLAAKFQPGKQ